MGIRRNRSRTTADLLAVAVAALLLSGCGDQVGTAGGGVDLGGSWHLVEGRDAEGAFDLSGRTVTLVRDGDTVGGTAACNLYSGTVEVTADSVTITDLGGTEMGCDAPVMALEQRYLTALGAVGQGDRSEDELRLSGPDVTLHYRLDPPVADAALVGTTWVLQSLIDGESVSSVAHEGELTFVEGGVLVGNVGCGRQRGHYSLAGDAVVVSEFSDRDPAAGRCPDDVELQHRHVVDVLHDRFTVKIEGDRLTLITQAGKGLDFRAG